MRRTAALPLFLTLVLASACDDPSRFTVDPMISSDTVEVAAPTSSSGLPTALDVTSSGGIIGGGRHPERQTDAERWDIAIRERDGVLVFVPSSALGFSGAVGITEALAGQTFDAVIEAPGSGSFITDEDVVIQEGAVYVVRSRSVPCGFGSASLYSKIQPIDVSADGRVTIRVATNEVCGDPRLVAGD